MKGTEVSPTLPPLRRGIVRRLKTGARALVTPVWLTSGLASRALARSKDRALILMYHAIVELEDRLAGPAAVAAAADSFRAHMAYVRRHMHPMALSELVAALRERRPIPSNAVCVTFDDGYEDNYTHAFPALRSLQIPATIYLTTGAVGRRSGFWWDTVAALFEATQHTELNLEALSEKAQLPWRATGTLPMGTPRQKQEAADYVSSLFRVAKRGSAPEAFDALRTLLRVSGEPDRPPMLQWAQIEEMNKSGVEFGAHTVTHPDLTQVPPATVAFELAESKQAIERRLGTPVDTFAFPYGTARHWSAELGAAARDIGFTSVVSAESGSVGGDSDLQWLPRVSVPRPLGAAVWTMCKHLADGSAPEGPFRASGAR